MRVSLMRFVALGFQAQPPFLGHSLLFLLSESAAGHTVGSQLPCGLSHRFSVRADAEGKTRKVMHCIRGHMLCVSCFVALGFQPQPSFLGQPHAQVNRNTHMYPHPVSPNMYFAFSGQPQQQHPRALAHPNPNQFSPQHRVISQMQTKERVLSMMPTYDTPGAGGGDISQSHTGATLGALQQHSSSGGEGASIASPQTAVPPFPLGAQGVAYPHASPYHLGMVSPGFGTVSYHTEQTDAMWSEALENEYSEPKNCALKAHDSEKVPLLHTWGLW